MNGPESLLGLPDDPERPLPSLLHTPADFQIAPLRITHDVEALPYSQLTTDEISAKRNWVKRAATMEEDLFNGSISRPRMADGKKPHLAISQLVDAAPDHDPAPLSLPSFVTLSAVERSPVPLHSAINQYRRPQVDADNANRTLPRPATKDDKKLRPVPLLPAMVTGLHEPPPSAGLLPSMDLDARPNIARPPPSKLKVKDILSEQTSGINGKVAVAVGGTTAHELPAPVRRTTSNLVSLLTQPDQTNQLDRLLGTRVAIDNVLEIQPSTDHDKNTGKDDANQIANHKPKDRRQRRIWSEKETSDLLEGVAKHGVGRWIAILSDDSFAFDNRTSVDLKDRYRVYPKDKEGNPLPLKIVKQRSLPNERLKVNTSATASKPRKRTQWTKTEDEALIKGISIHGFKWTDIHKDTSLKLGHRLPLVLKDRARNLVPDLYSREAPVEAQQTTSSIASKKLKSTHTGQGTTRGQKGENSSFSTTEPTSGAANGASSESAGLTLPRLDLEDDDLHWNNTLPPLLEWDELGM